MKYISIEGNAQLENAKHIEEVLCLSVLIANKKLSKSATVDDSAVYYRSLDKGCDSCKLVDVCLACIINE